MAVYDNSAAGQSPELRIEIGGADGAATRPVTIRLPDGAAITSEFPIPATRWEVDAAYASTRGGSRALASQMLTLDPVKDLGTRLFRALFRGPAADALAAARATANDAGLRLRLVVGDEEVANLPWEFLYDDTQGRFLALSLWSALVRQWAAADPPSWDLPPVPPPLKVLCIEGDPDGGDAAILTALAKGTSEPRLRVVRVDLGPTQKVIAAVASAKDYHVLHYSDPCREGAGSLGQLWTGRPGSRLTELLRDTITFRLAFLNAGRSDVVAAHLGRQVPAALGLRGDPTPTARRAFVEGFYRSLAACQPIEQAVAFGRQAVDRESPGGREWGLPVFHMAAQHVGFLKATASAEEAPAEGPPPAFGVAASGGDREVKERELNLLRKNLRALERSAGDRAPWFVESQIKELREDIARLQAELGQAPGDQTG